MPRNASVYIDCTLESQTKPFWLVDLAADGLSVDRQFNVPATEKVLNDYGVYQIEVAPPTLRLLINDTNINNQTVIKCFDGQSALRQTSLYLYGMLLFMLCMTWFNWTWCRWLFMT